MKRIKLVVAVAAVTAMSVVTTAPAVADDGIGERLENRLENRAERVEDFYDNHGYDVDIDVDDDDVYYSPFAYPFYRGLYGADIDVDDGELKIDLD
jgi:hypothetical protein